MKIDTDEIIERLERLRESSSSCGCVGADKITGIGYAIQVIRRIEQERSGIEDEKRS